MARFTWTLLRLAITGAALAAIIGFAITLAALVFVRG